MKSVIIVQARMTSQRLPGKVLKTVSGRPLICYQLERLKRSKLADELLVATTNQPTDDILAEVCESEGVPVFRGDEFDVLGRYYQAAAEASAEVVIRVTGDCPVIDPAVIDRGIETFRNRDGFDYVSNTRTRTYPRGMDTEVIRFGALEEAHLRATNDFQREHVTPYILHHTDEFVIGDFTSGISNISHHRWTVDEGDDFLLMRKIIEALYPVNPNFTLADILALIDRFPDWEKINSHVPQKEK